MLLFIEYIVAKGTCSGIIIWSFTSMKLLSSSNSVEMATVSHPHQMDNRYWQLNAINTHRIVGCLPPVVVYAYAICIQVGQEIHTPKFNTNEMK